MGAGFKGKTHPAPTYRVSQYRVLDQSFRFQRSAALGLCSWWSSNVEPYVEPSVSSYVPALRHRPTLPAILPTGSVATRPIPSRVTLYLYTTSRDHV